ncbi:hypothetical protein TorRG33x02_349620 [Trema orientale]|uniref:Uncharacterized protein n=1 Tax=Trema orientale TaxID=63057 RepID=A0A2P5AIE0_TREOI|nr:hypothetical protein TorRG33x02_349620 [Trema orientale]
MKIYPEGSLFADNIDLALKMRGVFEGEVVWIVNQNPLAIIPAHSVEAQPMTEHRHDKELWWLNLDLEHQHFDQHIRPVRSKGLVINSWY